MAFTPCFAPVHERFARGEITVENPAPGLLTATISGYGDDDIAAVLTRCTEAMHAAYGPYEAYHDWSGLTGYSSSARVQLTALSKQKKTTIKVFFDNKIIAMGVSVASLAVPGLSSFPTRAAFEAARAAAIAKALATVR